jgi:hypothetical protein
MAQRKTFRVQDLKEHVNKVLADPDVSISSRRAVALVLEKVLEDTENYFGFQYLNSEWLLIEERPVLRGDASYPLQPEIAAEIERLTAEMHAVNTSSAGLDLVTMSEIGKRIMDLQTGRDDYRRVYY